MQAIEYFQSINEWQSSLQCMRSVSHLRRRDSLDHGFASWHKYDKRAGSIVDVVSAASQEVVVKD